MGPRSPDRGRSALCRVRVPLPGARGRDHAGRRPRAGCAWPGRWPRGGVAPWPRGGAGRPRQPMEYVGGGPRLLLVPGAAAVSRATFRAGPRRGVRTHGFALGTARIRLGYGREGPAGPEVCPSSYLSRPPRPGPGEAFGPRPWPGSHVSRPPSPVLHVSRLLSLVCRRARRGTSRPGRGHAAVMRRPSPHPDPATAATGRGAEGQGQGRGGGAEPPKPPQPPCRTWHVQDTQREATSHMDRETSDQPAPAVRFGTFRPLRRRCRCCTGRRGPAAGSWRSAGGGRAPRRPTG